MATGGTAVSLKNMLDDPRSPLRQWLDERFPDLSGPRSRWKEHFTGAEFTAPPDGPDGNQPPYGWLGHGIGQRVQWMFAPGVSDAVTEGAHMCNRAGVVALSVVQDFEERVNDPAFAATGSPDELSRWALLAGMFEQVRRAGTIAAQNIAGSSSLDAALGSPDQRWVDDVSAVAARCIEPVGQIGDRGTVAVGPAFAGSALVGGADADLIVGGLLLDVKAAAKATLRKRDIHQLIMYSLLDLHEEYEIESVAILTARWGVVVEWDLTELLADMAGEPTEIATLRAELSDLLARVT